MYMQVHTGYSRMGGMMVTTVTYHLRFFLMRVCAATEYFVVDDGSLVQEIFARE